MKLIKPFKIFPVAMEHDLKAIQKPVEGEIARHKKVTQSSVKSVKSPSEVERSPNTTLNFASRMNMIMVSHRVEATRDSGKEISEKQMALEAIIGDRVLTPSMQKRKIAVVEQMFANKEDEKRKEKEAKRKQELDEALQGKRY